MYVGNKIIPDSFDLHKHELGKGRRWHKPTIGDIKETRKIMMR